MKHFLDRTRLTVRVVASSLLIVIATVAPQATAQDAKTESLERAFKQLEIQLRAIRSELNQVKSESAREAQKVMLIEEMATSAEKRHAQEVQKVANVAEKADLLETRLDRKNNMVFFRGGFAYNTDSRNGVSIGQADKDAWYVGAGFDWNLTKNTWGLIPKTDVMAELMFDYKEFGRAASGGPVPIGGGATVSQFTLSAAPKIKFMDGSKFRPWIIPVGLAIHVISPPTQSITYMTPGVMFGAGADYRIFKDFFVGADARYHLTAGSVDGIRIDGLAAGGYLGIGF